MLFSFELTEKCLQIDSILWLARRELGPQWCDLAVAQSCGRDCRVAPRLLRPSDMISTLWLFWMAFIFVFLVSPIGYGWGYRGCGRRNAAFQEGS
jgi:hypothetical protein